MVNRVNWNIFNFEYKKIFRSFNDKTCNSLSTGLSFYENAVGAKLKLNAKKETLFK